MDWWGEGSPLGTGSLDDGASHSRMPFYCALICALVCKCVVYRSFISSQVRGVRDFLFVVCASCGKSCIERISRSQEIRLCASSTLFHFCWQGHLFLRC